MDVSATTTPQTRGLTPEEDAELRRLNAMAEFGMVAENVRERYLELRARDRRTEIREPADEVVFESAPVDEDDLS